MLKKWREIYEQPKFIRSASQADWKAKSGHRNYKRQELLLELYDAKGVEMGAYIRIIAPKPYKEQDVTAVFIVKSGSKGGVNIDRLDFWPTQEHRNPDAAILGIAAILAAGVSHQHRFYDNAKIGLSCFNPEGNIGNAREIKPHPRQFQDLLSFIEVEWNIKGASELPLPQ